MRQVRSIAGVAPMLHFPSATPNPEQKRINTANALEMLRAQLGEKPEAYTRKYDTPFAQVKEEIVSVLASTGSKGAPLEDGKELTQLQVIERVLRHGLVSYEKNEGTASNEDIEQWLVYTAADQMEFNKMKRDAELNERYTAFKAASPANVQPECNWADEYARTLDREIVSEKRLRYDQIAATDFSKDEGAISAELVQYKQPVQDKALDTLIDQVNIFKPFLAKQVIQAKLIERNMDGQLSYSKFADWNPDARDNTDLACETYMMKPGTVDEGLNFEEANKRYADVRMKTKEEVLEKMDVTQQSAMASTASSGGAMGADDARRAQLLAEIVKLQSRASTTSDDTKAEEGEAELSKEEKEAAIEAARLAQEKEAEKYRVGDEVVKSKGLLGLDFLASA